MDVRIQGRGGQTRERLLGAAREVFTERGYPDATTAEICKRAGTNGAAINYHFGGKGALYVAVWRALLEETVVGARAQAASYVAAPPEDRLRLRIRAMLGHLTQDGPLGQLALHELIRPTGLIDDLRRDALGPLRQGMRAVVGELLGNAASEHDVTLCQISVANQCLAFRLKPLYLEDLRREGDDPLDLDELADHVTRFSLAGISEVRRRIESQRRGG